MGLAGGGLPGSRRVARVSTEQAKSEWRYNSAGKPRRVVRAYNATGGALTAGGVYALSFSGAAATTENPQLTTPATNAGRTQTFVVAEDAAANNTWAWVCDWGYVSALVEGTVDVTIDDALVAVAGQNYLVKAGSGGGNSIAEALVGQTANSAVSSIIYLRGERSPLDGGSIQYAEVSITNTEALALRATPKELVAAPGAGKVLEFLSCTILFDYTGAYTESTANLAVRYANTTGAIASQAIEMTGFADATADTMTVGIPKVDPIVAKTVAENAALVLHNTGAGEWGAGNAANVIRVKTAYRTHVTGW